MAQPKQRPCFFAVQRPKKKCARQQQLSFLGMCTHRFPFLEKVNNWNRFNENSGGTFVEKCCHFFDLMRLILRSDPVRVMASAGQEVNHLGEIYNGRPADIWDCGYVLVDFVNGTRAML